MEFQESRLAALDLFDPKNIILLVGYLRGDIIVAGDANEESNYLARHQRYLPLITQIATQNRALNHAQLNELFLILDMNPFSRGFFSFFFVDRTAIVQTPSLKEHPREYSITRDQFRNGIILFRGFAMLKYGNFRYAYKKLRDETYDRIMETLEPWTKPTGELLSKFKSRPRKALDIQPIGEKESWLTGYLSNQLLTDDTELTWAAVRKLRMVEYEKIVTDEVLAEAKANRAEIERKASELGQDQLTRWDKSLSQLLEDNVEHQQTHKDVIRRASNNLDVFLTWDHMDIYVATSMRLPWEFEAVHEFVSNVLESEKLKFLNLRYFDPTQCFTLHRLNKGLVESLILKRAKVTIYLVQESDTLGKDSELAATLAQGKPVVAFIPRIEEDKLTSFAEKLKKRPLRYFYQRFFFLKSENPYPSRDTIVLLKKVFGSGSRVSEVESKLRENLSVFFKLPRLNTNSIDEEEFKNNPVNDFNSICSYMAILEKTAYDGRARVLQSYHPLAVQVNLSDGVANGILVARDFDACVDIVKGLLLNDLQFNIKCECSKDVLADSQDTSITQLVEARSECPFRLVTGHRKITNSFWSFYLKERGE